MLSSNEGWSESPKAYPVPAASQPHIFPEPVLDLHTLLLYSELILLTPLWFGVMWLFPGVEGGSATHLEQEQVVPNSPSAFCIFLSSERLCGNLPSSLRRALGCPLSKGLCLLSLSPERNWLFTCRAGSSLPSAIEREARLIEENKKMLLILSQYLQ